MIRIKSGVYGARNMLKSSSDEAFSLSDQEEARLVDRGVAEYVYDQHSLSVGGVAIEIPAYDVGMTEKQLRGIAAYFRIDVSSAKKKQDIVDILDAHFEEIETENNEQLNSGESGSPAGEDKLADSNNEAPNVPHLDADLPT